MKSDDYVTSGISIQSLWFPSLWLFDNLCNRFVRCLFGAKNPGRMFHALDLQNEPILAFNCYHISEKRFFFGTWLTLIFFNLSDATPLRGLNRFTCRPTLIFFVRAPCGKTACTCGTTVLETMPPSGPMACTSCRMRDTTAKYCGKSYVTKRQIRPPSSSSVWLYSVRFEDETRKTRRAFASRY